MRFWNFFRDNSIGYALSGGFIKGFAHLGVMQALMEADLRPSIISGVSAGALAGVFVADGYEPYRVLELFQGETSGSLMRWVFPKRGVFNLQHLMEFLRRHLRTTHIEQLPTPMVITATDLDHGKSVHFRQGSIIERVAASCCMPVMFEPVIINHTQFVDGGVLMNLPASPIRNECKRLIGVNVSPFIAEDRRKNILGIAVRSYHLMFRANTVKEKEVCDLLIECSNLYQYGNRELKKAKEIFDRGYNTAKKTLSRKAEEGSLWK